MPLLAVVGVLLGTVLTPPGPGGNANARPADGGGPASRIVAAPERFEDAVAGRVSAVRAARGLPRLAHGEGGCLDRYAEAYARRMARNNRMAHHLDAPAIFAECGGGRVGEVVAAGLRNPTTIVRAWLRSPSHRRVVLRSSYRVAAVGAATSAQGNRFTSVLLWHR